MRAKLSKYYTGSNPTNIIKSLRKKLRLFIKREWLTALMETRNEKVINAYRKYEQINPVKIEGPGLSRSIKNRVRRSKCDDNRKSWLRCQTLKSLSI